MHFSLNVQLQTGKKERFLAARLVQEMTLSGCRGDRGCMERTGGWVEKQVCEAATRAEAVPLLGYSAQRSLPTGSRVAPSGQRGGKNRGSQLTRNPTFLLTL